MRQNIKYSDEKGSELKLNRLSKSDLFLCLLQMSPICDQRTMFGALRYLPSLSRTLHDGIFKQAQELAF